MEEDIVFILGFIIGIIFVKLLMSSVYKVINFIMKKKYFNKIDKNNICNIREENYDKVLTPVQVGVLFEKKVKFNHIVATILRFLDLGFIGLQKINKTDGDIAYRFVKQNKKFCDYYLYTEANITRERVEELKKNNISISEIYIIDEIIFKYYSNVNADRIYQFYDNYDEYSKLYNNLYKKSELDEMHYNFYKVKELVYKEFKEMQLINPINNRKTNLWKEKLNQAKLYKEKIKNDTLLPERTIENIYLWGEHLIYGVALNVCKTSIQDAKNIYQNKERKTNE